MPRQKPSLVIATEPLKGKSNCPLPFGSIVVMEDPLTIGPELDSKLVGKAQGFYISSAQTEGLELELVMGMTLAFIEGEYNGSTLSVLGRNAIFSQVREMPIIGGTGAFRFARGFVQARSVKVDYQKGDATVEYNLYFSISVPTTSRPHNGRSRFGSSVPICNCGIMVEIWEFSGSRWMPMVLAALTEEYFFLLKVKKTKINDMKRPVLTWLEISLFTLELYFAFLVPNNMAKSTFFVCLNLSLLFSLVTATYYSSLTPTLLGFREEQFTHLHFFFHDVVTGPKPSMVFIAEPNGKAKDALPFGTVVAMDDPLTVGPEQDSKLVGKAQGIYTSISQEEMGLMMVMTMAFTDGDFNGSTISVLGRNMIMSEPVREMAIVGGTGAFRFARGYAQARFYSVDFTKGDAIVEYDGISNNMAKSTFFVCLNLSLLFSLVTATYYSSLTPTLLGFREEKFTHLHFFFHDVVSGPKPSMVFIAEPNGKAKDALPFGTVVAMDDPLTVGPEQDSKLVGKAQGIYTSISQEEMGLMMVMTMAFTNGDFNGSTISVLGRNMIMSEPVREMAIVGGTGAFRFARGYAQARFYSVDFTKGDAIVEYDVFVNHY
ncbi:Dirigent protein 2 [Glycine soja]